MKICSMPRIKRRRVWNEAVTLMKLSNIERESNIVFNEAEATASVYTYNQALKTQLSELCQIYPE